VTGRTFTMAMLGVGCLFSGCSASSQAVRQAAPPGGQTSTTVPSTATLPPTLSTVTIPVPASPACPPGCRYPSNFDALTVLASSANLVAIVTVTGVGDPTAPFGGTVAIDNVLQGNPNNNLRPPNQAELGHLLALARGIVGQSYLTFISFDRGGPCLSALFSYNPATQVTTFISQSASQNPGGRITLSGRVTNIPPAISLNQLRTRLYPTGGVTYADGTAEWLCPGP